MKIFCRLTIHFVQLLASLVRWTTSLTLSWWCCKGLLISKDYLSIWILCYNLFLFYYFWGLSLNIIISEEARASIIIIFMEVRASFIIITIEAQVSLLWLKRLKPHSLLLLLRLEPHYYFWGLSLDHYYFYGMNGGSSLYCIITIEAWSSLLLVNSLEPR